MPENDYDAIVVGGGPAGSTAASTLANAGRNVLLLERETFPRYHIGESLVPGVCAVVNDIGLAEKLDAAGFLRKYGARLMWGAERAATWSFVFAEASPFEYVYEVKRAVFDNVLLEHSRSLGCTVIEGARVRETLTEGGRCVGVRYTLGGTELEAHSPWVVDASGQRRLIARDDIDWHDDLRNIAVWGYFQGGEFYPDKARGDILVENVPPDGWMWVIPFSDGLRSVGFVGPTELLTHTGRGPEEVFWAELGRAGEAHRLLEGARLVSALRTTRDWSYTGRRFTGPGYAIAGDAAAFIDPLFSSGVMLAMRSGNVCGHMVDRILADPASEPDQLARYERSYRNFLDVVRSFVTYFYDATKTRETYYSEAQRLIDPFEEMSAREDFVLLVSGLMGLSSVLAPDGVAFDAAAG